MDDFYSSVFIGVMVVVLHEPEIRKVFFPLKLYFNLDYIIVNVGRDLKLIRRANLIAFIFCVFIGLLTISNGFIDYQANMSDYKEQVITFLIIGIIPFRYICLSVLVIIRKFKRRNG